MINFFRKIRRNLADKNQFFRYSRYAIGEIVLVVIGILIALSINNWNENKKRERLEIETYYETNKNLKYVIKQLEISIDKSNNHSKRIDLILSYIQNDKEIDTDSLSRAFEQFSYFATPHMDLGYWETIKTRGVDLFSNKGLRQEISSIYEYELTKYLEDWDKTLYVVFQEIGIPALYEFIDYKSGKPFDAVSLRKNKNFESMLHRFKNHRNNHSIFLIGVLKRVRALSLKIEEEINRLEN